MYSVKPPNITGGMRSLNRTIRAQAIAGILGIRGNMEALILRVLGYLIPQL